MFLLILGIAAAFGTIAWIAFGLMSLVEEEVQTPYEAYREPENEEGSLTEEAVSIEAY
jgi:hypothetical protein